MSANESIASQIIQRFKPMETQLGDSGLTFMHNMLNTKSSFSLKNAYHASLKCMLLSTYVMSCHAFVCLKLIVMSIGKPLDNPIYCIIN